MSATPGTAPSSTSAPRRPRWRRRLLAFGLSVLIAFVGAEIVVRLTVGSPLPERLPILLMQANPTRGWEMVPGHVHYTYHHPVQVNALGLRGAEVAEASADEVRVFALGDSLVYGQGVGDEETLPFYLEEVLQETDPEGRTWTVVNGGHRAYDTRQEVALLCELGPEIRPDVVLLFWFWNDLWERNVEKTHQNLKDRGQVTFDTGDRVEGWSWVKWQAQQLVRRSALIMLLHDLRRRPDPALPLVPPKVVEEGFERLELYLGQLRALEEELGFRLLAAIIPDANALPRDDYKSLALDERAAALLLDKEIRFEHLRPPLVRTYEELGRLPVIPYDGHYDPAGNLSMARELAPFVLESLRAGPEDTESAD